MDEDLEEAFKEAIREEIKEIQEPGKMRKVLPMTPTLPTKTL